MSDLYWLTDEQMARLEARSRRCRIRPILRRAREINRARCENVTGRRGARHCCDFE